MARYYVSNLRGDDTTGTGSATAPWKTINKAIGSSPAITLSGGDTLYIEPGIYREAVTLGLSPTSVNTLAIVGDSDGAGFLAGGYTTPATGIVDWRGWSDEATAIAGALFTAVNKSYTTLRKLKMIGGGNAGGVSVVSVSGTSSDWLMEDCEVVGAPSNSYAVRFANGAGGAAMNATVRRCCIYNHAYDCVQFAAYRHTAEYSANCLLENCILISTRWSASIATLGSGSFMGTGMTLQYNTIVGAVGVNVYSVTAVNLTTPIGVYNNILSGPTGVSANNTTQVASNGNQFACVANLSNVTAGANDRSVCPALDFGDWLLTGLPPRPFLSPSLVSGLGAWGNYNGGSAPTVDLSNRIRPAGYGSLSPACGALERHDTLAKETTTTDAGGVGARLDGPADHYLACPVDAVATTLSLRMRYDANHGAAAKPQLILQACPEIGVSAQTVTMTAAVDTWETVTIGPFTPTAAGVVKLQVLARPAAASGKVFVDTGSRTP